jgi:hypothetical protein
MKKIVLFSLLGGFVFLLAGCEKDGLLGGSGEKVTVNFSLGDIDYKGDETVTRGYSEMEETVRVPLGDGVFMFATLEEDLEAPTRAGIALEDGVKVRIVAYNETTSAETSMEYTVVNGALTTSTAMTIETGDTYTFVAYSYNSGVSPTYPGPTITEAPTKDLLWGSASKTITLADNSVYITMDHVFAQVKVRAKTTSVVHQPVIKDLTGVTVTPGNQVDLTIKTGAVAPNGAATQTVSTWNDMNTTVVTSDPILVYTGTANPIYVNINSVLIDGYLAFTGIPPVEFKKALTVGTSYTLVVNFQRTIFAKSNIYWKWNDEADQSQGGYMTFDTQENGHQGYEGILFRWGSLVAASPARMSGENPRDINSAIIYKATDPMPTTYSATGGPGWPIGSNVGDPDANSLVGDVCKYINSAYRLPQSGEFGTTIGWNQEGWVRLNAVSTFYSDKLDGTYDFIAKGKCLAKNTTMGVLLPMSGLRDYDDSELFSAGMEFRYWTSTYGGAGNSCVGFYAYSDYLYPQGSANRQYWFPVRCVQN